MSNPREGFLVGLFGCRELDKSKESREAIFELFKSGEVHVRILKGQCEDVGISRNLFASCLEVLHL